MSANIKAKGPKAAKRSAPRLADGTERDRDDVQFIKAKLDNSELLAAKANEFDCKSLEEAVAAGERLTKKFAEFKDPGHPYYRRQGEWLEQNKISQPRANEAVRLYEWRDKLTPGVTFGKKAALRFIQETKETERATKEPAAFADYGVAPGDDKGGGRPASLTAAAAGPDESSPHTPAGAAEGHEPTKPAAGSGYAPDWKPEKGDVYVFAPPGGKSKRKIEVEVTAVDEGSGTVSLKSVDDPDTAWADVAWLELGGYDGASQAGAGENRQPTKTGSDTGKSGADGAAVGEPERPAKRKPSGDEDVGGDGSVDFIPTLTREEDEEYRPLLEHLMMERQLVSVKAAVFHAIRKTCDALRSPSEGGSRG